MKVGLEEMDWLNTIKQDFTWNMGGGYVGRHAKKITHNQYLRYICLPCWQFFLLTMGHLTSSGYGQPSWLSPAKPAWGTTPTAIISTWKILINIYVYIYVSMYLYIYVSMYLCIYAHMHVCLSVCLFVCLSVFSCLFLVVFVCVCLFFCFFVCLCVCVYTLLYHITFKEAHIPLQSSPWPRIVSDSPDTSISLQSAALPATAAICHLRSPQPQQQGQGKPQAAAAAVSEGPPWQNRPSKIQLSHGQRGWWGFLGKLQVAGILKKDSIGIYRTRNCVSGNSESLWKHSEPAPKPTSKLTSSGQVLLEDLRFQLLLSSLAGALANHGALHLDTLWMPQKWH